MNSIEEINYRISIGDTKTAIKVLKSLCEEISDDYYIEQAILIDSQYHQTLKNEIAGVERRDDNNISKQKVHKSIISLSALIDEARTRNRILNEIEYKQSASSYNDIKNLNEYSVKVAMAGQPNVGKTTLMRNIFKSEIGKVGDSSNVTTKSYFEENTELGITFIDCPGFNEPGRVIDLLEFTNSTEDFKKKMLERDLVEDYSAFEGLKAADLIYYVVSVMGVPNKSDNSLLRLIKMTNSNIIGIINMEHHLGKLEPEKSISRTRLWVDFFLINGISTTIHYDFAWDKPTKIHDLYRDSIKVVSKEKKVMLQTSLDAMIDNYKLESKAIAVAIFEMIQECKNIYYQLVIQTTDDHKNQESKSVAINEKIQQDIGYLLQNVIHRIKSLYNVVSIFDKKENEVGKDERILQSSSSKKGDQVREAATIGTGIGGLMLLKGLAMGAVTVAGGPVLILTTALIGGIVGLFSKGREETKLINFRLDNDQLSSVLESTIMILWISSNKGFGIGEKLDVEELKSSVSIKCKSLLRKNDLSVIPTDKSIFMERLESLVLDITLAKD